MPLFNKIFKSRFMVIPQSETQYDRGSDTKMTKARGCGMRFNQSFCKFSVLLQAAQVSAQGAAVKDKLVKTTPVQSVGKAM